MLSWWQRGTQGYLDVVVDFGFFEGFVLEAGGL
jgi:hypothetical protein